MEWSKAMLLVLQLERMCYVPSALHDDFVQIQLLPPPYKV